MIITTAVGRVGKDAQTRYTQGGTAVTSWSLAVDKGYGDKKETLWIDCSLWGERGTKVAPHILKGGQVVVTGEPGQREHDGKTYFTLKVSELSLVGGKGQDKPQGKPATPANDFDDSDSIPF